MIVKLKGFAPVEVEDTEVEVSETEIIFKDGEGFRAIPKRKIDFVARKEKIDAVEIVKTEG